MFEELILRKTNVMLRDQLEEALQRVSALSAQLDEYKQYKQQLVDTSTQTDDTSKQLSTPEVQSKSQHDPNEDNNDNHTQPEAHSSTRESKESYKPLESAHRLYHIEGDQVPCFPEKQHKFYLNPYKAIPHHNKGQNLKVAVIHNNQVNKLLLHRDTTCEDLHKKVLDRMGHEIDYLEGQQRYCLVYPRYMVIPRDSSTLWSTGMRYFPSYVWLCPYEFIMGDLMEVEFKSKGPSIDGDPDKVHPDALARRFGSRRGD